MDPGHKQFVFSSLVIVNAMSSLNTLLLLLLASGKHIIHACTIFYFFKKKLELNIFIINLICIKIKKIS